jgi:uncharacterized protein
MNLPLIGFGQVRHTRLRPQRNAFVYPTYFLMLPMRSLAAGQGAAELAVNRRSALAFYDTDHGDGRSPEAGGALAWLDELLAREGVRDARGEVWLHTYPRVLGCAFKPVSFWYCHRTDGALAAVVVEVNNTFGERHCYLVDRPRYGVEAVARKVFHVSPFCSVQGVYRFRFMRTFGSLDGPAPSRTVVRIDYDDEQGPLLRTSVSGELQPVTAEGLRQALWRYPAMTWMVLARIHWQALKLWTKRIGFHGKPHPPEHFVTR